MNRLFDKLGVAKENRGLLTTMYFSFFTSGMMSIMLGTLLPFIRDDYGLDYTQSGLLLSAHQIGNLCAVVFAGILPYLVGRKLSTLLLGSGLTLGLMWMTFTGSPTLLLFAFILTGVSRGTWSNICNTTIGQVSQNKTAALNILHATFAVGALLSPLIVFLNTGVLGFGWKGAAREVGILGIVVLVLVAASRLQGKLPPKQKTEKGSSTNVLKSKSFWFATLTLFFYLGAEASIIGWFVSYFTDAGILSPTVANFTPTILWFMIMIGRLLTATFSGRFKNKFQLTLGMALVFTAGFLVMLITANNVVSVLCILVLGISMAGIYPTTLSTIRDLSSTMANGLCIGIATFGAIILPSVVGAVADARGLSGGVAVILVFCAGMVAMIVTSLIYSKRRKKS